jgi:hypothetical protein
MPSGNGSKKLTNGQRLLAIDPGPSLSGWALVTTPNKLLQCGIDSNDHLLQQVRKGEYDALAVEMVSHYGRGMPAGTDIFNTVLWIGRYIEAAPAHVPHRTCLRKKVVTHLCGRATAKDSHVRQAVIDKWGGNEVAIGGAKCKICHGQGWRGKYHVVCPICGGKGYKHPPGPLKNVTGDIWQALGVAVYAWETEW